MARRQFKKRSNEIFWIARPDIRDILNKTLDKEKLKTDMDFLKEQKGARNMTLGSRVKDYTAKYAKRMERKRKYENFISTSSGPVPETAEFEFTSGSSDLEDDRGSESSEYDTVLSAATNPAPASAPQELSSNQTGSELSLPRDFVKDIVTE